jgi:hypothetical protein
MYQLLLVSHLSPRVPYTILVRRSYLEIVPSKWGVKVSAKKCAFPSLYKVKAGGAHCVVCEADIRYPPSLNPLP